MTEMDIQSISAHIEDQLRVSLSIAAQNGIEITREYVDDLLEPTAFMAVAAIPSISVADVIQKIIIKFKLYILLKVHSKTI